MDRPGFLGGLLVGLRWFVRHRSVLFGAGVVAQLVGGEPGGSAVHGEAEPQDGHRRGVGGQ